MLSKLLNAIAVTILCMLVIGLSVVTFNAAKELPQAPQIAAECPPGLAEQAAKKGAEYAKYQADFEALKKGAK